MEQRLFSDSEVFQKHRPTEATEQQLQDFFLNMAHEIIKGGWSEKDVESIADDIKEELHPRYGDGFDMAKKMERCYGYTINSSFVEWLENLEYEYNEVTDINVKTWVKAHDIKPKFKRGDKLKVTKKFLYDKSITDELYVTGFKVDTAMYLVHSDKDRNGGYVVTYEKVEECCTLDK